MRHKSEEKYEAILQATLRLVNELGFHGISMAKIAREAGVSPATIYIYFENKEDLINTLYQNLKGVVVQDIMKGYHRGMDTQHAFRLIWSNYYGSMIAHAAEFQFLEQFANSPYLSSISREEGRKQFEPFLLFFEEAMARGEIKKMSMNMVFAFFNAPLTSLAKQELAAGQKLPETELKLAMENAWNAVAV